MHRFPVFLGPSLPSTVGFCNDTLFILVIFSPLETSNLGTLIDFTDPSVLSGETVYYAVPSISIDMTGADGIPETPSEITYDPVSRYDLFSFSSM